MSFLNNIPNASDFILVSQPQLLNNFDDINDAYNVNHVPMQDQNAGKHSVLNMTVVADPTTASDEVALYSKVGTGSQPQIFYRPPSNGTPIQLSYNGTQINDGTYDVTNFANAVSGPPSTVQVTAPGNNFELGEVVIFSSLTGQGILNSHKQGTVTVVGSTFTISNSATNLFSNGAVTSGDVRRTTNQCQSFFAGPFIVLFGRVDGIKNADTFIYSDYYSNITFSSPPLIVEIMPTSNVFSPTTYSSSKIQMNPLLITNTQFTFSVIFSPPPSPVPDLDVFYLIVGQP